MEIGLTFVFAVIATKAACQSFDNQNGMSLQDTNSSSKEYPSWNTPSYSDREMSFASFPPYVNATDSLFVQDSIPSQDMITSDTASVLIAPNDVTATLPKKVTKLKVETESNKNFSVDVAGLLSRTNRVSFVREVASSESNNFLREFVGYLSRRGIVSFIEFDSERMYRCQKCNVTDEQKAFLRFFTLNHIIFVIYDTCESLNKSIYTKEWSIFADSPRSLFMLVIANEAIKGVDCSVQNFNDVLKTISKDLFNAIWSKFQILEMVMYYPYVCGVEKVLKYNPVLGDSVSVVSEEDMKNNPKILSQANNDLNGYPLKVKLFGRVPTSVKNMSESILNSYLQKDIQRIGNVGGIDGFTLANLVKYLNFSVDVSEPADGIEYGYMNQDGVYFGTLGDVIYKRADISFNGRFLKDYNAKDIEFTTPIYHDQFCVLVPKALIIPAWRNIFLGFSVAAWYMIMLTAIIAGVLWWIMKAASLDPEPGSKGALGFCVHFMDMCLLIASRPISLSSLGRERIFVAGCLIFNMIFSGVFQGYLNTAFSTTSHYPDINTLESLDQSGLPIATSSRLSDIFGTGSLQKKIKSLKNAAIDQAAEKRDVSAVERRSDARLLIELKYLAKDGEPLLHVVNECPRSYYLTYIVYRGYPFLPHIDRFIQRITEGGLNEQWYDFTMYSIVLHHRSSHHISSESLKKLTLVDVQTAFFALAIGLVSSSVVFICEYVHFRIAEKRIRRKKSRWGKLLKPDLFYISADLPKYQFTQ